MQPVLVAEVTFAQWTPDGSVRHASFGGPRDDKEASSSRRKSAKAVVSQPGNCAQASRTEDACIYQGQQR